MKNIRTIVCMIMVLALSVCLVVPAMAETEFVPSITYKQSVVVKGADLDGEDVSKCLVVTNVQQARDGKTDITEEARDLLVEVYDAIVAGKMDVPVAEGFVLRELVDISFMDEGCAQKEDHADKDEILAEEGKVVKLTVELGVAADAEVVMYAYVDGEWIEAKELKNNGDGTVDVTFENLCPVAVAVK